MKLQEGPKPTARDHEKGGIFRGPHGGGIGHIQQQGKFTKKFTILEAEEALAHTIRFMNGINGATEHNVEALAPLTLMNKDVSGGEMTPSSADDQLPEGSTFEPLEESEILQKIGSGFPLETPSPLRRWTVQGRP